jgi:N-acetylmuramoyl-L-alanine amidase
MVNNNVISQEESSNASAITLTYIGKSNQSNLENVLYFRDAVMKELENIPTIPKSILSSGGLRVFTTLDVKPSNYDVALSTRIQIVNNKKPNLLVTFAYSGYGDGTNFNSVNGFEVIYSKLNPDANKSKILANNILYYLDNGTKQRNRGVITGNYYTLRATNCPSVIVEAGFMTNLLEAKMMMDPDFQKEVGEECCMGVCRYLGIKYKEGKDRKYSIIKKGSKGNLVYYLQYKLFSRLYNPGTIDGIFGNKTLDALKQFQKDNDLVVDGIVGPKTWAKIKPIINN